MSLDDKMGVVAGMSLILAFAFFMIPVIIKINSVWVMLGCICALIFIGISILGAVGVFKRK